MCTPWATGGLRSAAAAAPSRLPGSPTLDDLPLTTPNRTLADLATTLTPHRFERALHRAEHLRLLDTTALLASCRSRALRAALRTLTATDPQITRSELEERFLALVLEAGLPRPAINATAGAHEVDFLWREHRLIVETDGAATHLTPTAFERDRARDAELTAAGYRVVRFTWRQVVQEPRAVITVISALLAPGTLCP